MAGISFLDLMFAEALASGLAREARRADRPPPDNFYLLPRDPNAWKQIQTACKKENMVIAVEITDNINENCRRVQSIFVDMAREFDSIPFLRAQIGLGNTFDELRRDLGGVQYTPTILIMFFSDDKTFRAKYEGEAEVRQGLSSGRIRGIIKEFLERRVKVKVAEHMAEELATHVATTMSEREKKIRQEYEDKMKREIAERDELHKREEEEKKKMEEEQDRILHQKRLRSAEIRRESRPQHLEELLKMNLDTDSIRNIKAIMIRMGISPHDCFERSDLKKKLVENVPELRRELERRESLASQSSSEGVFAMGSSRNSSISDMDNFDNSLGSSMGGPTQSEVDQLRDEKRQLETKLQDLKRNLDMKEGEIRDMDSDLQRMTARANNAESQVMVLRKASPAARSAPVPKPHSMSGSGGDSAKVKELETQLLETRMLYTTTLDDYNLLGLIHDSGEEGIVLRAQCTKRGIPNPGRVYAMKVLANYFQTQTHTQVRRQFENEYQVLCQLSPHPNIIHMYAFFFDRADPSASQFFKKVGKSQGKMSLFLLMDEHPMSMKEHLDILVDNQGPKPMKVLQWFHHLLEGLVFLYSQNVVHRDLKLDNLLIDEKGRVIISDFGKAVLLDESMQIPYNYPGIDVGGNNAHLAPEILNARSGPRKFINYSKQPVWAAGVLAYEFAGHRSPFQSGVAAIDQRGYSADELPLLKYTHCNNSKYCQLLPRDLTALAKSMLEMDPLDRPSLQSCLQSVSRIVQNLN